jgi:hypothetical protein
VGKEDIELDHGYLMEDYKLEKVVARDNLEKIVKLFFFNVDFNSLIFNKRGKFKC